MLTVSICVSWNSSWRIAYFKSSRMLGRVKSSAGMRFGPRSKPTTLSPALVSSRAKMLPVQPTPITTASTSLSVVTMVISSREIGDRLCRQIDLLAAIFLDRVAIDGGQAGIADHLPARLVAIAAIDRVGEKSLDGDAEQSLEEILGRDAGEFGLAGFHRLQRRFAIAFSQPVERFAVSLLRPVVGGNDAGAEEIARG